MYRKPEGFPAFAFDYTHGAMACQAPQKGHKERKDASVVTVDVIKCSFCRANAAATIFAEHGCTCSEWRVQHRCVQHMLRLADTDNGYVVVCIYPTYELLS